MNSTSASESDSNPPIGLDRKGVLTGFLRPFPSSFGNLYILLGVYYVSKWVEAIACPINDVNTVVGFIQRNILRRFGALRTIISDEGSHFVNKLFTKLLSIYGVRHDME